jgi:hypothetical protein
VRAVLTALALLGLAVSTEGCNVTVGNNERSAQRDAISEVLADGEVTLDLTDPPSRADLGMQDGRESVILEREGGEEFDVTVVFRDGTRLTIPAVTMGVYADDPGADPTSVTVRRAGEGLPVVETALDEAVSDLGVDRAEADAVVEQSARATDGQADVRRSLTTSVQPPDRLSLRTIAKAIREEYAVNYTVEWDLS